MASPHEQALRLLLKQWRGELTMYQFVHNFIVRQPRAGQILAMVGVDHSTPEGLLLLIRQTNWRRVRDEAEAIEALYRQVRGRHQLPQPHKVSLSAVTRS